MFQQTSDAAIDRASLRGVAVEPEESLHSADLLRHLERLDLLIQRAVLDARRNSDDKQGLEGLMYPAEVLESAAPVGRPRWALADGVPASVATGDGGGIGTRLQQLVSRFSLSPFERDLILLADPS